MTKIPEFEVSTPFSLSSRYFGQFRFHCPVLPQWKQVPSFAIPPLGFKVGAVGLDLATSLPFPLPTCLVGLLFNFFPLLIIRMGFPFDFISCSVVLNILISFGR